MYNRMIFVDWFCVEVGMEKKQEKEKKRDSLQSKLVGFVVIGILICFTFVIGISIKVIGTRLWDEADAKYQVVTDNVSEEITTWFSNEAQIVLNQKASIEILDNFEPDYLAEYLTRIVQDYNEEGYIYDLYFVNTDNVMSSGYGYVPEPGIDFRTRAWYVGALDRNGLYYSAPYKDSNLDRYVVTISTTCYKSDGTLAGVLALDIFVDTLFSIANDKVLEGDSYVFLLDNNSGLATHPNEAFGYVNDEPLLITLVPGNIYGDIVDYTYEENEENSTHSHYSIMDYDGVHRFFYVSKIESCGWYAVAAIESAVFITPLLATLMVVFFALIVCLSGGIIVTRIVTSRIIRQLNDANEEAIAANETKGVFLANMSHEIRTPINAIIGMNEMVIRENKDPVINDYALDIASASRSLVTIVNDILDFSKIESGKMEIVETEFNIASVINDIVNMSESRLGNKELTLFFHVNPEIPLGIIGDEMRIKQIILNMMTNAIKYTQSGFVSMRVDYSRQEYGINLNVFVKDTGIGIAEENIERLYESFQRFDSKRNRSIEGTGLGLSISKRLIESMGGFINVKSKLGEGSEFSFSIPLKISNPKPFIEIDHSQNIKIVTLFAPFMSDDRLNKERQKVIEEVKKGLKLSVLSAGDISELKEMVSRGEITHVMTDKPNYHENPEYFKELSEKCTVMVLQKRGDATELPERILPFFLPVYSISIAALLNNKKQTEYAVSIKSLSFKAPEAKIMIVDDNTMNLKVAVGLMKPYNMKVSTVDSGAKAIEILSSDPTYDIVFMDHMMPEMDGIEATKRIREMKGDYYKNLTIIALTANTLNNAKTMFLQSGFNDFLAKPINIAFLDQMLQAHLPKSKMNILQEEEQRNTTTVCTIKDSSDSKVFDSETGLKYAADDLELYLSILKEYVETYGEMRESIQKSFEEQDWKTYVIKVHALKSMSMTIGAVSLSELAKEMELSGKAEKYEPILEKTDKLLKDYDEVLILAREYLIENNVTFAGQTGKKAGEEVIINLNDINHEELQKYVKEFMKALEEYDSDRAEEIYEAAGRQDVRYETIFGNVMASIRSFEYDSAKEEIERIINA